MFCHEKYMSNKSSIGFVDIFYMYNNMSIGTVCSNSMRFSSGDNICNNFSHHKKGDIKAPQCQKKKKYWPSICIALHVNHMHLIFYSFFMYLCVSSPVIMPLYVPKQEADAVM